LKPNNLLRLNRAIASCGLCSRRAADDLIASGKVKVNGQIVTDYNSLVDLERDRLSVSGQKLFSRQHEYIMLHKPKGVVSTCQDEHHRKNIIDLLPTKLRHLRPAGRLDYDSSGLILLTNDGDLINSLTHPTNEIEKTYQLVLAGEISRNAMAELASGINLKEAKTKAAKARLIKCNERESIIEIAIKEGKNRQLRRMCAQLGLPVLQLVRTAVSKLQLGSLASGKWRYLSKSELHNLRKELKFQQSTKQDDLRTNRTKIKIRP
jgi:23S rRNA pseudouridine2605 synthase